MKGIELIVLVSDKSTQGSFLGVLNFGFWFTSEILLPLGTKNSIMVKSIELKLLSSNPDSVT